MAKGEQSVKEQPQVTVRGIPQNQYNDNVAATTQTPPGDDQNQGGIEGHFKKHAVMYTIGIGVLGILVVVWFANRNSSGTVGTNSGYDTTGYGTGNSSPSDLYGSQLDADYQQMINTSNITNSLLQQMLNPSKGTTPAGGGSSTGGTSGSGSSSGSSGGHKKPPTKKPPKKTKPGGNTGGSSGGHTGSTNSGHTTGSKSTSSHSVGTSHSNGKTTVKPNPHAGGAKGHVITVGKDISATAISMKAWPGSNYTGGKGNPNIFTYANNSKALKGHTYQKGGQTYIKAGTKISI